MATYFFETITEAQAEAFDPDADQLVFGKVGETARTTTIVYNPAVRGGRATVTIISGITGRQRNFPVGIAEKAPVFPDGSQLQPGELTVSAGEHEIVIVGASPATPEEESVVRLFEEHGQDQITIDLSEPFAGLSIGVIDFSLGNDVLFFGREAPVWLRERDRFPRPPKVLGPRKNSAHRQTRRWVGG